MTDAGFRAYLEEQWVDGRQLAAYLDVSLEEALLLLLLALRTDSAEPLQVAAERAGQRWPPPAVSHPARCEALVAAVQDVITTGLLPPGMTAHLQAVLDAPR